MAKFNMLTDYDGSTKWYRRMEKGRFHVMELMDWEYAVGEKEAKEIGSKYNINLSEVDLLAMPAQEIAKALDGALPEMYDICKRIREIECEIQEATKEDAFKGQKLTEDFAGEYNKLVTERDRLVKDAMKNNELMVLECVFDYGHQAPLFIENGNNIKELRKMARDVSAELDDPEKYEEAMNKPVNKIGSTAREYMQGDINAALFRNTGDPITKLMRKISGFPEKCEQEIPAVRSVFAKVNPNKIPSDDPIAYMGGYVQALSGSRLDSCGVLRKELAPAYIEGYQFGVMVKKGDAQQPSWHK
jgi:Txe/YoeB family toxin of Txe-Axe toxin-antitoxin module